MSEDAVLAIAVDAFAGGDMPKSLVCDILRRWTQEGDNKNLDSRKFLRQIALLKSQQEHYDTEFFPPDPEVYVVNTEHVVHASRGRIAKPCECQGEPEVGNIFVVVNNVLRRKENEYLDRVAAVDDIHLKASFCCRARRMHTS